MTSIALPASVEHIDPAFFQQFPGATAISVAADNPDYQSNNGMLFNAALTDLLLVPEGMEGAAVLPLTLASVPACVLTRCHKLSAMVFPNGGTGSQSLTSRNGLLYTADMTTLVAAPAGIGSSVEIAPETKHIAEGAFWGNAALDTIVVHGDVQSIVVNPVYDAAVATVEQAEGGESAEGDTAVWPVPAFMPQTVENATVALDTDDAARGAWEAAGFTHFNTSAQPGDVIEPAEGSGFAFTLLDDYTLAVRWEGEDAAPAALRIPAYGVLDGTNYAVSTIASDGFAGQTSVVTVDAPDTLTSVDDGAFAGCTSLQTISLPNAVSRIGVRAFMDTALLSVVLPTGLETLGAQAFGELNGTVVVALRDVALVSDAAFDGSTNLSVYVPVRADGNYAISAGLPASGNHIYPYGVQLSDATVQLAEGESANLFNEGSLEAPGAIEVNYAYKARAISVDTETGDVEAKQVGNSNVAVSLTLKVPEMALTTINSEDVRLETAAYTGTDDSAQASFELGGENLVMRDIALASASTNVFAARAAATPAAETPEYGFTYTASDPSIITIATDSQVAVNKEMNRQNWTFGSLGRSSMQNTFIGDIKWTGGTAASPTAGSVVTVNVASGGMKLHPEFMTTEVYRRWLTGEYKPSLENGYADDVEGPLRKLVGFRFPTTNSYVTLDQITSGEAFTFSFIIPDEGLGTSKSGRPDYITGPSSPAADGYVGVSMHFTPGIVECVFEDTGKVISGDWHKPTSTSDPLAIEGSAAVVFFPNGGVYENTKMDALGLPDYTSSGASVWSDIGGEVQLPSTGRLYRDNYVFVGWYDTAAATGGNPIPDTMTSDMAGKAYYARWQAATNTFDYSTCGTGIMCISSDFIIDSLNYPKNSTNWLFGTNSGHGSFRGKISWTGGTDRGPAAGSTITVDMPRGGYDLHPWFATEEVYRMWFSEGDGAGWGTVNTSVQGGDAVKKLLGFRFPSTGSYVSLETAVSGESYTFSFVLPASGFSSSEAGTRTDYVRSPNPTDADYAQNSTDTGTTGLRINYTKGLIDAVYEDTGTIVSGDTHDGTAEVEGSAAVYFYPNGGQYRYAYYSEGEGGRQTKTSYAAAVWSTIGERIYTPESVLDAPAGKVFAGWYDTSAATGGERLPDTLTSAVAGKRYYARWATATNTWDYSAVSNGVVRIASRYVIENFNYPNAGQDWMFSTTASESVSDAFKGTITWTGGTVDGPGPGSTVTVNVPAAGAQLHSWFMTDEIWKRWFNYPRGNNLSNGGNALTELKGFWFPSTGSYVTLEKATSGEAYNFTFIIPDSGYGAPATGASYDAISAPGTNGFAAQSGIHLFNTNVMECDYETVGTVVRGDLNDPGNNTNPLVIDGAAAVYFNPNGGRFANENMARAGLYSTSTNPAATFSTVGEKMQLPTHRVYRDGMVFLGWYDTAAATGGNEISDTMESSMAGKTYYARWMNPAVDTYEVRYNANGGTGTIARDYMNMAAASTLSNGAGFKRVGYEVTAWTTNADGTGVKFTTGQTGILPSSFTDRTVVRGSIVQLYAQWTPIEYYVVLTTPGQTSVEGLPEDTPLVAFETTATAAASYTLPSPRLRGHNFDSWYTTYDNEENTWGGNKLSAGDAIDIREYVPDSGSFVEANEGLLIGRTLMLYAGWTEKNYTVHFRNDLYSHKRPFVQDKDVQVVQNIGYNEGTVSMLGADVTDLRYDGRYYTAWGTRKYNSTLADVEANKTAAADTATSLSIKEIVDGTGSAEYMDDPWNSTDIYLYPQWEFIEFSITFAHNYATDGDGAPKDSVTLPANKAKLTLRDDGLDDGLYVDGVLQEGNLQLGRNIYSGYGYEHLGWNTADSDLSKNVFEVGIAAGGVGVMAFRDMFEVEYDPNDPALSTTTRGITLVPQWNEYSYDIVLRNGAVTSGGTTLATGIKYHESVELPRDTFTKPGYSLNAWAYGSEEGENKYAPKNPLNEATLVSAIVTQNAVTGNNVTLPLYAVWHWRTDIPYYVYAYYEAADGTYATGDGVMMYLGYGSMGEALTLDDEYKVPALGGYEYDEGITEARNDGAEVKEDGTGCLRVYFKKQYTVEFRTGTGGVYTADDGVVTSTVTYDHGSGASANEVGTPATVADAAAALDEVSGFFDPAAGNYFAKWLPTNEYAATTDRDQNAAAADLPSKDVTENLSFTTVFKTIAYKLVYKHAYIAGMPDAPDDSTLAATEFAYADLASAATQPNVGSSTAIVSPVGFTHTGWQLEDKSQQFGLTDKVTLDGDANSTFVRLGFTAVPAAGAADPSTQEVTLCATWNERTYSIDFWKFNSIRPRDMCTVNADDGYYTDLGVNDKIKLPSQDTTGTTKPSVSDSIFSYNIASWNVLDDADGTKKATFLPGHEYTVLELLGGENALELPDENNGVLNLYAGWKVVYSADLPDSKDALAHIRLDLTATESMSDDTVRIVSRTPRTLLVGAESEVTNQTVVLDLFKDETGADLSGMTDIDSGVAFSYSNKSFGINGGSLAASDRLLIGPAADESDLTQLIEDHLKLSYDGSRFSMNMRYAGEEHAWGEIAKIKWIVSLKESQYENTEYLFESNGDVADTNAAEGRQD